jgi:flagellin-like protein
MAMDERWITGVFALLVLFAFVVALAKLIDLARRRRRERAALRGRLTDALMRDPRFTGLPLVPKVRVPFWSGSPARIRLTGVAPSTETRQAALEVLSQAAAAERSDVEIEDRTKVSRPSDRAA